LEQRGRVPSSADGRAALRSQWEAFQQAGTVLTGVRPEIAASWRRSAASQLHSALRAAPVDEAALRGFDNSGHAHQQFTAASTRMAESLATELEDTVAAVVVCDDFGVVLYRAGRPEVLRRTDDVNLVPGGVWNERTAGTNGIGLALELGSSAQVYAAEHYIEALHGFSCTAAIVRHPVTREPLGVLGLATDTSVSTTFARPLIVRAARDIERLLEDQVFGRERELLEHYLRSRAGRAGGPISFLTVDRAGHTVIQNARMLQGASTEDVQLLLSLARHALSAETDLVEELELSRGRSHADVRLVHAGDELLGALVSLERAGRARGESICPAAPDWAPLVGRSPAMQRLFREAAKVAEQRMTVSIQGETGTGKLSLAQRLHRIGGEGPLTLVHCAREGWEQEWQTAAQAGGTIVLRRVHGLHREAQLQLCDQLDDLREQAPGVWVISLLNSEFERPCPELLSRLARVSLIVPALRDRGHDVRLLIEDWCDRREQIAGIRPVLRPEAYEALEAQPWPGNVRELHNALDAGALRSGTVLGVESLQLDGRTRPGAASSSGSLREIEREAISAALERSGGNVSRAAKELGIGRATLHRRLRAYRLLTPHATDEQINGNSRT
jgi:transcriptional regulator of acetoin/glycerol metabolism